MELLLYACVLGHYVKIYFLTVDPSPKSLKYNRLRQLFLTITASASFSPRLLLFFLMLFSYLPLPYVYQKYPLLSLSGGSRKGLFDVLKIVESIWVTWLKESQKHYTAFKHANLDHSLLTAWHLSWYYLISFYTRSISRLVKEGKCILNLNHTHATYLGIISDLITIQPLSSQPLGFLSLSSILKQKRRI